MRLAAILLVVAALSGCTIYTDPSQREAHIIAPTSFQAGSGEITNIGVVHTKDGTRYRLYLRMDPPAGTQSVDVDRNNFFEGQAVELTNDGRVVSVSGTTLNSVLNQGR